VNEEVVSSLHLQVLTLAAMDTWWWIHKVPLWRDHSPYQEVNRN